MELCLIVIHVFVGLEIVGHEVCLVLLSRVDLLMHLVCLLVITNKSYFDKERDGERETWLFLGKKM